MPRELGTLRDVPPHPSRGGTRGYPVSFRISELRNNQRGIATTASASSLYRWKKKRLLPFRMTGHHELRTIIGHDLFLFLQFIFAFPEAEDDEVAAFIYNCTGHLYNHSQISRRKNDLLLTRKRASTEAEQAYSPEML